ncbi:hypothetical protein C8F01DRAFT_509286 [Mycena amicta]|nr:hypothetical protein C8F01DRAFT_509286 [Mycena amicta]
MFASPFADILHTNTVPSDKECEAIRALLTQPRYDAEKLDKEVEKLQELLSATLQMRDDLRLAIGAHEALISPMRRAPDDVLRTIFIHSLPNDRNIALSGVEGPLLLGQICRRWRDIALMTPRLWATMHVVLPDDLSKLQILKEMVISRFEQSGAVPLGISLQFSRARMFRTSWGRHHAPYPLSASELLPVLLAVSSRWRSIQLIFSRPEDLRSLADLTVDDVPHLQHMELSYDPFASWDSNNSNVQGIQLRLLQTSSLRSFSFFGSYALLPANLPWANLRYLKLATASSQFPANISFPFRFLEQCRMLTILDISLSGFSVSFSEPAGGSGPIQLPHLTELALAMDLRATTESENSTDPQLFDLLQTPALRYLGLTCIYGASVTTLFRPIPFLQSFMMSLDQLLTTQLASILDALPLVEELTFVGEPFLHFPSDLEDSFMRTRSDGGFLETLIPTHTTQRCPALRRLKLSRVFAMQDSLIVMFLKSRTGDGAVRNAVARLTHFTCDADRKKQLEIADELVAEMRDGLELCLSYHPPESIPVYSPLEGTELENDRTWLSNPLTLGSLSSPFAF